MNSFSLRLDHDTEVLFKYFLKVSEDKPQVFDFKIKKNRNAIINLLLKDYLSILANVWERHPNTKYRTAYQNLMASQGNSDLDKLTKRIDNLNDLLNKLYYLQIYANNNMIYDFAPTIDKAISIFDEKSPVFLQNQQLKKLVNDDKKHLFAKKQRQRKLEGSHDD